jgi:aminodeoxyfutalosine synthase
MIQNISKKVEQGERLSDADALWLFEKAKLIELGKLANKVNLQKNGRAVFYNINRHINPTNICALSCKFCAYSKKIGEDGGYAYEIDEMIEKAGQAVAQGATELHMVGGLHPRWPFQRYVDMISAMHKAYPDVHLKAFTAVELDWMARRSRKTLKDVMQELKSAGLGSFPGGGAEIFHPEVRDQICDTKVSGEQWIETHRTAHQMGLRSNCTMLYGHIEKFHHRVDHMRRLRELQDETGGFNVFIPLAFQPFQNEMGVNRYTFGSDDLRTIAVARLYLDNFKNIKSYWVMLGQDIAQLALQFGANDLDGTVLEEKISRAAGGRAGMIMTRSNLEQIIRRSDRIPVERTTLYAPVHDEDHKHMVPVITKTTHAELPEHRTDTVTDSYRSDQSLTKMIAKADIYDISDRLLRKHSTGDESISFTRSIVLNVSQNFGLPEAFSQLREDLARLSSLKPTLGEAPFTVILNVEGSIGSEDLRNLITNVQEIAPESSIVIQGLAWIQSLTKSAQMTLMDLLAELKSLGISTLVEGGSDALNLELEQRWTIIEAASFLDIETVPSLTLQTHENAVDWTSWALALTKTCSVLATHPKIKSCAIQMAPQAVIMPGEYLKAIGLARSILPESCQIWTPLQGCAAITPHKGLGAGDDQHPAMKLVSTLGDMGSESLGFLPSNIYDEERIIEDIVASGRKPLVESRESNIAPSAPTRLASLRHTQIQMTTV